ncbi:HVO_2922 family protein [Halorubellus sp. PRR65]|uniref:HVO_2922 family protein n=1 Tax=Halorubellus sp. PRR65 TaxID=3098148 RepID=UPI002B25CB6F|nr:HVO_2922 family protein [Halorubellus sp. PRR65]
MTEETVHKSTRKTTRAAIGAYLHRVANAFERGEAAPVDDTVTVDMPPESEMEVDVERAGDELTYELEFAWPESEGGVDTDATVDDGVAEDDGSPDSQATFELYEDKASEWRWRLRHDNGNIIADSGEGYGKKANARNGIQSVKRNAPGADVEEQD